MHVKTRHNILEPVCFDKITNRIRELCTDLPTVDPTIIAKDTVTAIFDGISTSQLDEISATICAGKVHDHPDYGLLGGRIIASNISKNTFQEYEQVMDQLYRDGQIKEEIMIMYKNMKEQIQEMFDYSRDYLFDYFAMKTLTTSFLLKVKGVIVERPQHMYMRVAIQVHGSDLTRLKETYDYLSQLYFTHATPTLFNSCSKLGQLASCFLLGMDDDLTSIFKTMGDIAQISKLSGGIGLSLSNIRCAGSIINGTKGKSSGLLPLCKTLEQIARYINQGGKRKGSIAVYLEPHHGDIEMFIEMRKPTGDENLRARDLFTALWVSDLFMKRVEEDKEWSLFCPNTCPLLYSTYGEEFERLYEQYEREGKAVKVIRATELWSKILESQMESGMPYISYKDQVNRRNMQKHLGVIRNSNLCVVGSTKIMIKKNNTTTYEPISTLQDQQVEVWNGEEWSETTVRKTASEQELVRVSFTNGAYIDCTPYHRFPLEGGKYVCASDLHPRMVLQEYELPKVNLQEPEVPLDDISSNGINLQTIPFGASVREKVKWFTEYCKEMMAGVGIRCQKERIYISDPIDTVEGKDTLLDIRLFLQTLGVDSKIFITSDKRLELQFYPHSLFELGFQTTLEINQHPPFYNEFSTLIVHSVKHLKVKQDTYCFTESKRNMGMFNGILTMNCNEISLYSDAKTTSVCNLASICLPKFIEKNDKGVLVMNFEKLQNIARILTRNLNLVIDKNYHPTPEALDSNKQNRPIGIGVQGLSCCFAILKLPFDSKGARELNHLIFEHIYYGAVKESIEMAKTDGPYPSYSHPDCPHRQGLLHFMIPNGKDEQKTTLDWEPLVADLKKYGIRNSVLTALMPTASTSQICGNNECFEPIASNLYLRSTMSGEFVVINKHLVRDLIETGLWTKEIYEQIVYWNGSIQKIVSIPLWIRELYKTAYEVKTTSILNLAIDRGGFVDQTQSMNIFMPRDLDRLHSSHFYAWKGGLKTGMYYLRTQASTTGNKFGLDVLSIKRIEKERSDLIQRVNTKTSPNGGPVACPRDPALREICDSCSS